MNEDQNSEQDLDCIICNNILYKPVSISCGHTFCKDCLLLALRAKPLCPLCRSPTFLQTQTLNENITLRNLIESKYPKLMQKRQMEMNMKPNNELNIGEMQRNSKFENEIFDNFFTLKVQDLAKFFLFPSLTEIIKVSCDIPIELFNLVCQDKKFVVLPENHSVLPLQTYVAECHEILSSTGGKMRMEVKILKRVMVQKTFFQMNENDELLKKFSLNKNFGFFVTSGMYYEDNPNFLEAINGVNPDIKVVDNLVEFFKKNLANLSNVSPNTFVRILHKIGENNIKKLVGAEPLRDFPGFSTFSFIISGSLRAKPEEKRRMFETISVLERLEIANNIIKRFNDTTDPLQIFEVDIPTQKMFSLKYSIFLIIAIGIVLYYNRFYQTSLYF